MTLGGRDRRDFDEAAGLLSRRMQRAVCAYFVSICVAIGESAAAPSWSDGRAPAPNAPIRSLLTVENSAIPSGLYAAGDFTAVGPSPAARIARWDGAFWSPIAPGPNAEVRAMILFDDDGPGSNPPALIVAGAFADTGAPASRIAACNGAMWTPLGLGVNGRVNSLTVFDDDGAGAAPPRLYVAGAFSLAGGEPAANLARWDGVAWSAVADTDNEALVIAAVDPDGPGAEPITLIAGGWFTGIAGVEAHHIARRVGASWLPVGTGFAGPFPVFGQTVTPFDPDGPGPQPTLLYVGGFFTNADDHVAFGFASWDGAMWSPVAGGIGHPSESRAALVHDDDGADENPERLFVGGNFIPEVGGPGRKIGAWDGVGWSPLAAGMNLPVNALAVFDDDGAGPDPPALFAGGEFTEVDGAPVSYFARWGTPRTTPPPCPDANGDGAVNFADITSTLQHFGESCPPACDGDANHNGAVNFADITAILTGFGMICD